jgi:hypothetical protein
VLAGLGQALDRSERGPGHEPPEHEGEPDSEQEHAAEDQPQVRQHLVDLVERAGELDGAPARQGGRQHADVLAVHLRVPHRRAFLSARAPDVARLHRQPKLVRAAGQNRPAVTEELHERHRPPNLELGRRDPSRPGEPPVVHRPGHVRDSLGARPQRTVYLTAQLTPHEHVGCRGREQHRDRDRAGRRQGESLPEGHYFSSRSTYPTPRTVWTSLGSRSSSSFRRR